MLGTGNTKSDPTNLGYGTASHALMRCGHSLAFPSAALRYLRLWHTITATYFSRHWSQFIHILILRINSLLRFLARKLWRACINRGMEALLILLHSLCILIDRCTTMLGVAFLGYALVLPALLPATVQGHAQTPLTRDYQLTCEAIAVSISSASEVFYPGVFLPLFRCIHL